MAFETICLKHIEQIKKGLGDSSGANGVPLVSCFKQPDQRVLMSKENFPMPGIIISDFFGVYSEKVYTFKELTP